MVRVRHYTRVSSMRKILTDGKIVARDRNSVFVESADGRKLSAKDVEKRYDLKQGKGNAYIEFDADENEVRWEYNLRLQRNESFIVGSIDLNSRNVESFLNF